MEGNKIRKVPVGDMSREEWLAQRRKSIGGSDAGAVLGLSQYKSPYALWAEKSGRITPGDISSKEAVREGRDLEQYVAQRWSECTGKKLRRANCFYYNDAYPFAHANVDRMVVGESAGFEAKTTSDYAVVQQCRNGRYPDSWRAQMLHYLMVTGKQRWYLGVLCFGRGFYCFELDRDEEQIRLLARQEEAFWQGVRQGTPPPVDGSPSTLETLQTILGDSREELKDLEPVGQHVTDYVNAAQEIKALTARQNLCRAKIMDYLGSAEKGCYGDVTVSFKTQQRSSFDRAAYEAAKGPIGREFFKQSVSRPFQVHVRK